MDLIFMTCQPFNLNMLKTEVLIFLTSRPQTIYQQPPGYFTAFIKSFNASLSTVE